MKGGEKLVTSQDVFEAIIGKSTEERATDPRNCMNLLNILENIRKKTLYEKPNNIELTVQEYNLLQETNLAATREVPQEIVTKYGETSQALDAANREYSKLISEKHRLQNELFIWKRERKLSDLERHFSASQERIGQLKRETEALEYHPQNSAEREIMAEGKIDKIYVRLNQSGKSTLKDLKWIYRLAQINKILYGSSEYADLIKSFREGEGKDFSGFFADMLKRLNSLSDAAGALVSQGTGFGGIEYDAEDQKGGGFAVTGWIRYARNIGKKEESYDRKFSVREGYTGFTFDQVDGPRMHETNWSLNFSPIIRTIEVSPTELGNILIEHKKTDELSPIYEPTEDAFFHHWTYVGPLNTYNINPSLVPAGNEREYVMHLRGLNRNLVEEIETTFPAARRSFDALVERIKEGRATPKYPVH